jgi:hypothetical protein
MSSTWTDRWRLLTPPDTVVIDIGGGRRGQRMAVATVAGLSPGCNVVLRGSHGAVQRVARDARVGLTRELIPLPTRVLPAYLVEDDRGSLRRLFTDLLSVPPGMDRLAAPADALLRLAARVAPLPPVRRLLRWRIAFGQRL